MSPSCKKRKRKRKISQEQQPLEFQSLLRGSLMYLWKSNIYVAIFIFLFFLFFSKYIATFIYHAFYCIAIAQVQIIQENREEKGQKKENEYREIPLPTTRHWKQVSAEERKWARGRGGGWGGAMGSDSGSFFSSDLTLYIYCLWISSLRMIL